MVDQLENDEQLEIESLDEDPGDQRQVFTLRGRAWSMVITGVAMLLIGSVLGYLGRGVFGPEAQARKATSTAISDAIQTRSAANKEVMEILVGETRHFKGDASSPVTIIEFSDFQ